MSDTTADSGLDGNAEVKRHLHDRSTWIRLLYMLILGAAWTIAEIVFVAVVVLQFLTKLFTGKTIDALVGFSRDMAEYMAAIVRFEAFVTEELPFPFAPWPSVPAKPSER